MIKHRLKSITFGLRNNGGRSSGTISTPRRGSLVKRNYRFIDSKRTMFAGEICRLIIPYIYDPNRSGHISLIMYPNGMFGYILAVNYREKQKLIYNLCTPEHSKDKGYSLTLHRLPRGSILSSLGFTALSAGSASVLLSTSVKNQNYYSVRLASGEYRLFSKNSVGVFGAVSNPYHQSIELTKAGQKRLLGFRPRVRPSSMNPVDHPMGGRTRGGFTPRSRTGILSLGTSRVGKKYHRHLIKVSARKQRLKTKGSIR